MFGVSSFAAYGHGQWLSNGDQWSSEQSHQRLDNHQFRGERQNVNLSKGAEKEFIVAAIRLVIWGLKEVMHLVLVSSISWTAVYLNKFFFV